MKYEAKADDNGDGTGDTNQTTGSNTWPADTYPISNSRKLVSTAAGYPVAKISQTTSITAASSYIANCDTGCHLMTEAEWMTIAQNVLSVAANWSGGSVGSGYIYSGHNDNDPANAIEADPNGADDYYNTGNSSPSNQRRKLTLTNNEVIWDLAGNVYEWTQGTIASGRQPGLSGESAYAWKEWNDSSLLMNGLSASSQPSSIGISGVSGWSSTQGIGQLYSNYGETAAHAVRHGGTWNSNSYSGVLAQRLSNLPGDSNDSYIGLRVTK
jgi:formylglycine-generating enzyme required for sulfatase activity